MFKDDKGNWSWTRVMSTPALFIMIGAFCFCIYTKYDPGLLWSGMIIIGILGLKGVQKQIEK